MNLFKIEFDKKRIYGLDILRALAVFSVVLVHSGNLLPEKEKAIISLLPFPDGVSVFFVLSGFLIGGILIKVLENEQASLNTLLNFWKRRWLRTLPVYFLILILLILLSLISVQGFSFFNIVNYFIFCQNFNTPHPPFFIEAWSLSVEEWFYFLIPSIIFILVRIFRVKPEKAILSCIITIILATIIFRYYRYLTIPVTGEHIWGAVFRGQVVTRLDSLMFGVAGAYFSYYHPLNWIKYKNQTFILGLTGVIIIYALPKWLFTDSVFYYCNLSFTFTSVTVLLVLPFLSQLKSGKGCLYKTVTYTSLISYSLYLTHATFMMQWVITKISLLQSGSKLAISVRYALYWVLSVIIAILLYKFFEMPFMAIRDRMKKINPEESEWMSGGNRYQ
jgi:peptidoglycan/LPS O-acetylase OafA/YrhL